MPTPRTDIVGAMRRLLTRVEVKLLAAYLHDRTPQRELADRLGWKQTTVSARLRRAVAKLANAGFPVQMPGRAKPGWIPDRPRVVTMEPDAIAAMETDGADDGRPRRKWVGMKSRRRSPDAAG